MRKSKTFYVTPLVKVGLLIAFNYKVRFHKIDVTWVFHLSRIATMVLQELGLP